MTAVYDAILEDLFHLAQNVGKHVSVKLDGSQLSKVNLDKNEQTNIKHKDDTFTYKKLKKSNAEAFATYVWRILEKTPTPSKTALFGT